MWKFLNKRFGRSSSSRATRSVTGSVADLRGKFYLEKHCTHGFPLGPSCMTFDPHRRVLFIGTTSGELRMIGQSGVELTGLHDDINRVIQVLPFASEPSVITVCSNNIMHKWSLVDKDGNARLVLTRTYKFQGGLAKTITVCCLPPHCDCLFVGTLGGITYPMDTQFDGMSPEVLSWSRARAYLGYKGKDVPGEVRTLDISPVNPKQLLIGYEHSYLELWDALSWKPLAYFGPFKEEGAGDLLATNWHSSGQQFITSHQDGTVGFWNTDQSSHPFMTKRIHGDAKVQEISRIFWPSDKLLVMSGGAPLDEVDGDSVTVSEGGETVTLQLTSPVRSMHVLEDTQADRDSGIVNAGPDADASSSTTIQKILVLLLEQEILFINLQLPDLPLLQPPYLYSMHNSPLKCVEVYSGVSKEVWSTLSQVGWVQQKEVYRAQVKAWPVDGGHLYALSHDQRDLLITGHEDGTVKFWDISESSMHLQYVIHSSKFFSSLEPDFLRGSVGEGRGTDGEDGGEHRHTIRPMGFWDPRSDDDQLQVTTVHFQEHFLAVGFHGGKVLLFSLNNQSANATIKLHRVSILRDDPRQRGRNWQAPLDLRTDSIECPPGYQPVTCFGIFPNVAITTVSMAKNQKLIGIGCIYGFTIIDYLKNTTIHVHSTHDPVSVDEGHLSRMQSIRRSFRQSLKRFNVRHSMRGAQSTYRSYRPQGSNFVRAGSMRPSRRTQAAAGGGGGRGGGGGGGGGVGGIGGGSGGSGGGASLEFVAGGEKEVAPLRRDTIRSIFFTAPCHVTGHSPMHGVVVGTNQGGVLAFSIDMPAAKHRDSRSPIMMPIEREFNVKKNHPVLFVGVFDSHNYLLSINDRGSYHSTKGGQYMVVCTEDMMKVVTLSGHKKKYRVKFKHSDNDEYHAVSAHYLRLAGQSVILVMDSEGFISIYNLPDMKLLYKEDCVDASDAVGQRNFVMGSDGLLLHQRSPSEFTRGSVTEQARLEFHFSLPSKRVTQLHLAPNTPKSLKEEHFEVAPEIPPASLTNGFSNEASVSMETSADHRHHRHRHRHHKEEEEKEEVDGYDDIITRCDDIITRHDDIVTKGVLIAPRGTLQSFSASLDERAFSRDHSLSLSASPPVTASGAQQESFQERAL